MRGQCFFRVVFAELGNNCLQLLYSEVKGILLYPGFSIPILSTKHPKRSEGRFVDKIGQGNPWLSNYYSQLLYREVSFARGRMFK